MILSRDSVLEAWFAEWIALDFGLFLHEAWQAE